LVRNWARGFYNGGLADFSLIVMTASNRFAVRFLPCAAALIVATASCSFENVRPDLPLATAPGYEIIQVPNTPQQPATWDRRVNKIYDATWVPPAEGSLPEGQAAHPFFRDPKPAKDQG
jgi:hypothetical protein